MMCEKIDKKEMLGCFKV